MLPIIGGSAKIHVFLIHFPAAPGWAWFLGAAGRMECMLSMHSSVAAALVAFLPGKSQLVVSCEQHQSSIWQRNERA